MARGFILLFWGLIFVFVDFRIERFEIAPDFIGFVLVALGCHSLWQYTPEFRTARHFALPMIPLSLIAYGVPSGLVYPLIVTDAVLTFLLVWFLLGALIAFSKERGRVDLAGQTLLCRRVYAGIAVFAFLVEIAAQFEPERAQGSMNFAATASLVLLVFILRILYSIKQDLVPESAVAPN